MNSNFLFLQEDYNLLYNIAYLAEKNLYSDPNTCMFKLRQFSEVMMSEIFQIEHIPIPAEHNQAAKINTLKREGLIEPIIADLFHQLRLKGNHAVHSVYTSQKSAETLLRIAYKLARWFASSYGEGTKGHSEFVLPEKHTISVEDLKAEKEAQEKQIETLQKQLFELQKQKDYLEESQSKEFLTAQKERVKKSQKYAVQLTLSEAETRKIIDAQLQEAGWQADSILLKYSQGIRPQKGKNIAIAEFPTNTGKADYALFAGLKLVGIVEAKPEHKDISAIIANQCKDYATNIKSEHSEYVIGKWGTYQVPFVFATNGRKYLKQLETKSGIWFLDTRRNDNIPKALQGWKSPQGLLEDLEKDIETANQKLAKMSYDLLRDEDGLNLREYQIKAVEITERELLKGKQSILLSMATGTGKTRTLLAMMYRFLKAQRFKRILFLVDRTSLGEQAHGAFKEVRLEELLTLNNNYSIKGLEDKTIERETKIHLSTVQAMVKRILYNEGEHIPSVSDYDLIIIDEAHRGYTLDKEMADDELEFRNQADFVSKYRVVIDYFDAVKIAVTATPALHTTEIFGKPVFEYSYREAVLDGFLVDHNPIIRIETDFNVNGIKIKEKDSVKVYDPITNEILNLCDIEDEILFDVESFNRNVITESFNRVVLQEIAKKIDPEGYEKTLIFAVNDAHADLIVKILKEIYAEQGVDNDAVKKITGSIGDKKRVLEAIKEFKTQAFPTIAVTVDLLTTGIDVPEITSLVFMRRVKSRILYDQMVGRATRLYNNKFNKKFFNIYDAVGIYDSFEKVSNMKPVAVDPIASLDDLLNGINRSDDKETISKYSSQIIARLRRKLNDIDNKKEEYFQNLSNGLKSRDFVDNLNKTPLEETKEFINNHIKEIEFLFYTSKKGKPIYIIDKEDTLLGIRDLYNEDKVYKPDDYIEEFSKYISENRNKIAALNVLCTSPKQLSRKDLKKLRLELDLEGFPKRYLNHAWNNAKNVDILTDIIGMIRTLSLGNSMIDYRVRLETAFKKLESNHDFTGSEKGWLERIKKQLLNEEILDKEAFDDLPAFKNKGGYQKINKAFKNQLDEIVDELKEYLFVV